jgi:hypothetical protein
VRRGATFTTASLELAQEGMNAWQLWGGDAVVSSMCGLLPKAGPGRALLLALRSRFFFKAETVSVRHEDAATLKQLLREVDMTSQGYIEVTGPAGVGRLTLMDNVFAHKGGPVVVNVEAGALVEKYLMMLTGLLEATA